MPPTTEEALRAHAVRILDCGDVLDASAQLRELLTQVAAEAALEEALWHRREVAGPWPERETDGVILTTLKHQDERIKKLRALAKQSGRGRELSGEGSGT